MSRPVPETPPLPYPSGSNSYQIAAFNQDLTKALYTYLSDIARRTNESLPKDGTEAMKASLDMGGFSILNVGNITISGTATFTTLHVTGAATFDTTLAVTGVSTLHGVNMTGNLAITGNETVSGTATDNALVVTTTATVAGSPVRTEANSAIETIFNGTITASTAYLRTGLSAYKTIIIEYKLNPDTTADYFEFRSSANGGGSYSAALNWVQALIYIQSGAPSTVNASTINQAFLALTHTNTVNTVATVDYPASGTWKFTNWNKTDHMTIEALVNWYQNATGTVLGGTESGYNNERIVCDSFQIKLHNGGAFSGDIHIMGVKG